MRPNVRAKVSPAVTAPQASNAAPIASPVSDVGAESDIVKAMYTGNYLPYQFRKEDLRKMLQLPDGAARVELWQRLNGEAIEQTTAARDQSAPP
ncbi:hypothetical protein [Lacipirellula parvula]|uniref:Uncharacterized protein n=1 Tax=Lacipirellula parvula TaxID=2650471 RepID=A0A5K7XFS0_9BACT|nr:hypothetical protein [Lacipirellula parvula]BBO35704.1 hypothetical protein PLANPX_5316 [Lacipirellula parvula]